MFRSLKPTARALVGALTLLCLPLAGAHASVTILKNFSNSYLTGAYPVGQLAVNSGTFYGMTQYGLNGDGDIFKMTTTGAVTILHEFAGGAYDGSIPTSGLLYAGGYFYGTAVYGGTANAGTLFRIAPNGAGFTVLHSFTGYNSGNPAASDGANPYGGLLLASDGNLYGTTVNGGSSQYDGTIYMYNPSSGSYSVIHSFNHTTDTVYDPYTGLAEGTNGALYGTTNAASGYYGGLYKLNKNGSGYAFVHGFTSSDVAGYYPQSDLITASDGNIYGLCDDGGAYGAGTVFKLVTSTGSVTPLWAFDGYTGALPGDYGAGYTEQVRLLQGSDHNLYGVTQYGGYYGWGTAFKLTLAGACSVLTNFNYNNTFGTANPLVQNGTSFYATSFYGGIFANPSSFNGDGAAVSISATGAIKVLQTFYQRDAYNPFAGLVQVGSYFYGEAYYGGEYGSGYLYKTDSAGHLTVLHQMNDYSYFLEGDGPAGGLLAIGTSLYGMTSGGGKYGGGTLFKSTTTGKITLLHQFSSSREGYDPFSALTKGAGTDANLYGTLARGGSLGYGSVFSTNTSGSTFKVLHYFGGPDGINPECTPVPDGAGNLWGTCYSGGANNDGTIWKVSTNGSTFTKVYDFDTIHGENPYYNGHLYLINGILYGTTWSGGANGQGVVWAFNTATSAISLLHTFKNSSGEGYDPCGLYYDPAGGNFYGTCLYGGAYGDGTLWKINVATGAFTKLYAFAGYNSGNPSASDAGNPYYAPILGTDGFLYGTTYYGGSSNGGV